MESVMDSKFKSIQTMVDVLIEIITDSVKAAGAEGLPSGHLYAFLCGHISLDVYEVVKGEAIRRGLITEENYLLRLAEGK